MIKKPWCILLVILVVCAILFPSCSSSTQTATQTTTQAPAQTAVKTSSLPAASSSSAAASSAPATTSSAAASTTAAAKTLQIGSLVSLTGFASASESLILDGQKLFQTWYNNQGGLTIAGQKYNIEIVAEDSQSTADGAAAAANKLVLDNGIQFVVGPVMPFMTVASGTVTEPNHVLRVALYNAATPEEYGADTPYTFIANDCSLDFISPNMEYMKEAYPDLKTITVLSPDDGGPPYIEPVFKKKAEEEGLTLNEFVLWSLEATDLQPSVQKALSSNPDALYFINGWPIHMGSMLKAARQLGFTGPVFACHEDAYDIREVAGVENSTEFYTHNITIESSEMTPEIKEIIQLANATYGKMSATYVWGWSPVACLMEAIEAAQSVDPEVVKNTWEQMETIDTVYGEGRMGGLSTYGINHNVSAPMALTALKDGEVVWIKWQDVPLP